jgi:hypothetical protein
MALPLDTPVGTEIVCVDASDLKYLPSGTSSGITSGLVKNAVYVLVDWTDVVPEFRAVLVDLGGPGNVQGFDPRRFRRLELGGLDALLRAKQPVDA